MSSLADAAAPFDDGDLSGNKGETEIVLPRSQKLRVVSERRDKGYLLYHLRTA